MCSLESRLNNELFLHDHINKIMDKKAAPTTREIILEGLNVKSRVKSNVFNVCIDLFNQLKEVLGEISNDLNEEISTTKDRRVRLEYRDRGKFEAELKFADDVLIFSMHTDVFQFDREHPVWKNEYVKKNPYNSYCGVISVYNFLYDSMKYNRAQDMGYLVARIFVNKDGAFFVEGKRQESKIISNFGKYKLGREGLVSIVESAILYAIAFDLLVPPYDMVKVASVEQINNKIDSAKMTTGKRMGFKFNSDDVLAE